MNKKGMLELGNIIGILFVLVVLAFIVVNIIDDLTSEVIKTVKVKCIDSRGVEFEDELCIKEIKCGIISSNWKWWGGEACHGK